MRWGDRPLWALHRVTLGRAAAQTWTLWRRSGLGLMAAYLGACALVGLYSLWQAYRFPLPWTPPELFAGLAAVWWLSAGLARRPALGLGETDALLLRTPASPWLVLAVPLLRLLGLPLVQGLGLGVLLAAWFPPLWPLALALPLLAAGRPLVQTLFHDCGLLPGRRRWPVLALACCPLLAAWNLTVLPLACVLALAGWAMLWRGLWLDTVHAAPLLHARVEGWRQGARRLGLPLPEAQADGCPPPRRWLERRVGRPRGTGAVQALWWRGLLHLARQPWRVLAAVLVGLSMGAGSPVLLALTLGPLLTALAPPLPPQVPLAARTARLLRTLPAAVLSGLSGHRLTGWTGHGLWPAFRRGDGPGAGPFPVHAARRAVAGPAGAAGGGRGSAGRRRRALTRCSRSPWRSP